MGRGALWLRLLENQTVQHNEAVCSADVRGFILKLTSF